MSATTYIPDLSLTADQQGLLRTALSSNLKGSSQNSGQASKGSKDDSNQKAKVNGIMADGSNPYPSPVQDRSGSDQFASLDDSPLFENYDLEDGNIEWDNNADQFFGDGLGDDFNEDNDIHDKRKASTGSEDGELGTNKRQESDNTKTAKKPGRKPLTAEPTTKRKAQNRAAQRAFRERKERHLKDLETKVEDMEKASEATNHENGRLRAQVEKLTVELKEYRKRLSLNSTAAGHSPPLVASQPRTYQNGDGSDFQFAFPKFGDLPGASFLNNGSLAKTSTSPQAGRSSAFRSSNPGVVRNNSSNSAQAVSPTSTNEPFTSPSSEVRPYRVSPNGFNDLNDSDFDALTGLFSPSILETTRRSSSSDYISREVGSSTNIGVQQGSITNNKAAGQISKVLRRSSASMTNSPASSMSHAGLDSSCGTTPESSADSPDNRKASESGLNTIKEEGTAQNKNGVPSTVLKSPVSDINGIDWLAQQNGGQFDPVLFGDYRDPQDSILNNTFDDFFNDAYPTQDFTSPYNTGSVLIPEPKRDLMKEIEIRQDGGDDEVVSGKQPKEFLGCDKLWDRLRASERYKSGESDMDDLCSQLKSKAKCSGKGAVISQDDVDRILGPPLKQENDMFQMFS